MRPHLVVPPLGTVRRVLAALEAVGAAATVGGSGLLAALGLVDTVRDWDITTDAPADLVLGALLGAGLQAHDATSGGVYATRARYVVDGGDHEVDVLVGFGLRADGRRVAVPVRVTGEWRGLPLADPVAWAEAYRLMGRHDRADLLAGWISGQLSQPRPSPSAEES